MREVDAVGGLMAAVADNSGTMFHVLNASKGAAVQVALLQFYRLSPLHTARFIAP